MIDWNYIVSQIATVAFDILYFGAIISTIVIIILDNRNPVKTMAWILAFPAYCGACLLLFLRPESASGAYNRTKELRPLVEETYGGILGAGLFRYSL